MWRCIRQGNMVTPLFTPFLKNGKPCLTCHPLKSFHIPALLPLSWLLGNTTAVPYTLK